MIWVYLYIIITITHLYRVKPIWTLLVLLIKLIEFEWNLSITLIGIV